MKLFKFLLVVLISSLLYPGIYAKELVNTNTGSILVEESQKDKETIVEDSKSTEIEENKISDEIDKDNGDKELKKKGLDVVLDVASEMEKDNGSNLVLDAIEFRKEGLKKITDPTEEDKKVKDSKLLLLEAKVKQEVFNDMNKDLQLEIEDIKKSLLENQKRSKLLDEIKATSNKQKVEINKIESENKELKSKIENKEQIIASNEAELLKLKTIEARYEILLNQNIYLKEKADERKNDEQNKKINIFYIGVIIFILLTAFRHFIVRNFEIIRKRYKHFVTYFDVLSVLLFVSFLIWVFFYIKPELTILLVFLSGYITYINADTIGSLFTSVFILKNYKVGQRISFGKTTGIIEKLTALYVVIRPINKFGLSTGQNKRIPNRQFAKEEVSQADGNKLENTMFEIVIKNSYKFDVVKELIEKIETEILSKLITKENFNRITEAGTIFETELSYIKDGNLLITFTWSETRGKNNEIKRKIISFVDKIKLEFDLDGNGKKANEAEETNTIS